MVRGTGREGIVCQRANPRSNPLGAEQRTICVGSGDTEVGKAGLALKAEPDGVKFTDERSGRWLRAAIKGRFRWSLARAT